MLGQRRLQWTHIEQALGRCLVFDENLPANARDVDLMVVQRRRWLINFKPVLAK